MKVVVVSHAHLNKVYRDKFEEVAKDRSIDLTLIVPHRFKDEFFDNLESNRFKIICKRLIFPYSFHGSFFWSIKNTLKELKPDIVYLEEEPYNLSAYLVMRAAKKIKTKFIIYSWQNIKKKLPFPFSNFYNAVLEYAHQAITGNRDAMSILKQNGFKGKITIIPQMGVKKPNHSTSRTEQKPTKLIYLGRIIKEKGIETIIEALPLVDEQVQATIIGNGPYKKNLIKIARKNGVQSRVKFLAQCGFEEVQNALVEHHALVLPSRTTRRWKEQFGRVLIEAMMDGVPVIGSNSGEIPNVIGNTGLIFKEGDAADLACKVKLLFGDKKLYQNLKKQGIERANKKYANTVLAKSTIQVFNEVYRNARK